MILLWLTAGILASPSATPPDAVVQTLGSIGPWRTDEQEHSRQLRFKEMAEAGLQLRKTLEHLVKGEKEEARQALEASEDVLLEAEIEQGTPQWVQDEIVALRVMVTQALTMEAMRQAQITAMAEMARRIEQDIRDEQDIIALLLN